mmetsp:Transcript_11614/g.32620  ORF Transcript_11614/g.32620 Transcript_11614/m.32620 type:complete len:99 (-) Transcript_11614:37-333(-)
MMRVLCDYFNSWGSHPLTQFASRAGRSDEDLALAAVRLAQKKEEVLEQRRKKTEKKIKKRMSRLDRKIDTLVAAQGTADIRLGRIEEQNALLVRNAKQ